MHEKEANMPLYANIVLYQMEKGHNFNEAVLEFARELGSNPEDDLERQSKALIFAVEYLLDRKMVDFEGNIQDLISEINKKILKN